MKKKRTKGVLVAVIMVIALSSIPMKSNAGFLERLWKMLTAPTTQVSRGGFYGHI